MAVAAIVFQVAPPLGARGGLSLQVNSPATATVGQRLKVRFTVTNVGAEAVYFKKPWKWAENGMQVVAIGADGAGFQSTTELFDIDGNYLCTFFKPLSPGNSFSFDEELVVGSKPVVNLSSSFETVKQLLWPHLELRLGTYKLRWVYEPRIYEEERHCAAAAVPIWSGHAESSEVVLDVRQ